MDILGGVLPFCSEIPHPDRTGFLLFLTVCSFIFFLAVLGLHCCAQAFSSCGERGPLFIAVRGLLIAVASLVVGTALGVWTSVVLVRRLSSCGSRAQ